MLRWAVKDRKGPIAIRYPRGGNGAYTDSGWNGSESPVCVHREGKDLTIITYGTLINNAMAAAQILSGHGIEATVIRLMCINPLSADDIICKLPKSRTVFVAEEIAGNCGIREHISCLLKSANNAYEVSGVDLGNRYIQHGAVDKLYEHYGLSAEKLAQAVMEVRQSEN